MCEKLYDCYTSIEHRNIKVGVPEVPFKKLIMECTYVHVQSDLKKISLRKNMHLFMTVTSKCCINQKFVVQSLIKDQMHLFALWVVMADNPSRI